MFPPPKGTFLPRFHEVLFSVSSPEGYYPYSSPGGRPGTPLSYSSPGGRPGTSLSLILPLGGRPGTSLSLILIVLCRISV